MGVWWITSSLKAIDFNGNTQVTIYYAKQQALNQWISLRGRPRKDYTTTVLILTITEFLFPGYKRVYTTRKVIHRWNRQNADLKIIFLKTSKWKKQKKERNEENLKQQFLSCCPGRVTTSSETTLLHRVSLHQSSESRTAFCSPSKQGQGGHFHEAGAMQCAFLLSARRRSWQLLWTEGLQGPTRNHEAIGRLGGWIK